MGTSSREKSFIKSIFILSFGTLLPKFASFITLPIYTAYLTKIEYGTFDLIQVLCTLLLPVATLQIQSAVFRFLLDEKTNEKNRKSIITSLYCFVIPVSLITLFVLYFVLYSYSPQLRILIIIYYFMDILFAVTGQTARGLMKNHVYSIGSIINAFLNVALVIPFIIFMKMGLNGLMLSLTIAVIVADIYYFFSLQLHQQIDFQLLDKDILKKLLAYSWPMIPNAISLWVIRMSDRTLITIFLGLEANSIYAVANKIPSLLQLAQNTFFMAWAESASISIKDKDADAYYTVMFKQVVRFMAGISAVLFAFQPILFKILIKGDYGAAYNHISILILGMYFSTISSYLGGIYLANMRTKKMGTTTVMGAIINFVINLMFIKQIGVYAATLSTSISYLFLMLYRMYDVKKFQKIEYSIKELVIINSLLLVMCIICFKQSMWIYVTNFIFGMVLFVVLNRSFIVWGINYIKAFLKKRSVQA